MMSANGQRRPRQAVLVATGLSVALGCSQASAGNALERGLERLQPCNGLRVDIRVATIGVDNLEKLTVEEIQVTVKDDAADAYALGSLACRTSDAALKTGDASARFSARVHMDLGTCTVSGQQVEILSTGGIFGGLVDLFRKRIQRTLEGGLADQLKRLCQ